MFSFILVFVFNAMMWTLFVKSLRGSTSSATATVSNTGSNFISTVSQHGQWFSLDCQKKNKTKAKLLQIQSQA